MSDNTATHKIFGIGASGLIGSRVSELLAPAFSITNLSTRTGVNITDPSSLSMLAEDKEHSHVILFAAKADVDGCERDKEQGNDGDAWKINVEGARNVAEVCRASGKTMIYISTDFVFNGKDAPEGGYAEDDKPDPVDWYGTTKYEGEKAVQESGVDYIIARVAYPYRALFSEKKDFVHVLLDRLRQGLPIKAVTDHVMTPTYVDDIAEAIKVLIQKNATGIYHVVGSEFISPYDAVLAIGKEYGLSIDHIEKTTREQFFQDRAPRPFDLSLKNDRMVQLGARMRGFSEGLRALRETDSSL